jgi:predicted ATPase
MRMVRSSLNWRRSRMQRPYRAIRDLHARWGLGRLARRSVQPEIVERLRSWRALIVLDNRERLIEALAGLAEDILQMAPDVRLLATSQEILGLRGRTGRSATLRLQAEADAERLFLRAARLAG